MLLESHSDFGLSQFLRAKVHVSSKLDFRPTKILAIQSTRGSIKIFTGSFTGFSAMSATLRTNICRLSRRPSFRHGYEQVDSNYSRCLSPKLPISSWWLEKSPRESFSVREANRKTT